MHRLYTMPEGGSSVVALEDPTTAPQRNQDGYGIFWTIQEFNGRRIKENLAQINGFAVDIDGGETGKPAARERIRKGLLPTWIIETKNGYHVYWLFPEPLQVSYSLELEAEYRATIERKLIPFYGADRNAKDLCRLLRAPYFWHRKDPTSPFLVKPINTDDCRYTWSQINRQYQDAHESKKWDANVAQAKRELKIPDAGGLFQKIWNLDNLAALEKLSGHEAVNGEVFTFRRTASGNHNILVNGKGTSCWVDAQGKIGSHDKGGPTIWQWLYWYLGDHKKVYRVVREVFGL